jgi:hypothetical protein
MIASSGLGSLWVIFRLGFAMVIGFDGRICRRLRARALRNRLDVLAIQSAAWSASSKPTAHESLDN